MRQPEVEVIQVVKVTSGRGDGTTERFREVTGYYTMDGRLIHEDDPQVSRHYGILQSKSAGDALLMIEAHRFPEDVPFGHGVMVEVVRANV